MSTIIKKRYLSRWLNLTTLTFGILAISFANYVHTEKKADEASDRRLSSVLLADELRHSSDNLTRMVRSYVMTGNPEYKQYYLEILDIRDGRKPRLQNYPHYWDRVIPGEPRPTTEEEAAIPLLALVQNAAFGDEEYRLLAQAKHNSDLLAKTELEAIRLFESTGAHAEHNRNQALKMLFDSAYEHAKLGIMRPISEFSFLMNARAEVQLEQARARAAEFRLLFIGIGLFWLLLLWRSYSSVRSLLGASPNEIYKRIKQLGSGDLSTPTSSLSVASDSVIAWLNETRQRLQTLTLAQERSEARLRESNHYLWINNHILQRIGDDTPLQTILDELTQIIEEKHPEILCSVLLANAEGTQLQHASAPSMPPSWLRITARVPIAEGVGSCGTAAYRGERVIVEDIQNHPYWRNFREQTAQVGLHSCWSQPFKNSAGEVLGTFAIYHREPASPSALEIGMIEDYAQLARLAVERAYMAEDLRQTQKMYRLIAENSNDVIWLMETPELRCSFISPSVQHLLGWSAEEAMAQPLDAILAPGMESRFRETIQNLLRRLETGDHSARFAKFELELQGRDARILPVEVMATVLLDETARPNRILSITRDISERKAAEEAIRQMAFYDWLTNLPNRRLLEDRLERLVVEAQRNGQRMSLLFIDLDKFKPINDRLGHATGDWLLQQAAARMQRCVRASETIARIGGDEFVVLLPDAGTLHAATKVAEKLQEALAEPFVMADKTEIVISSSIGVAIYPDHAETPRDLLRFGDEAMYRAKKTGRALVAVL